MWYRRTSKSKKHDEEGVAITTEYVLLLGIALAIFSAMYIGFNSFENTSLADSRTQSATMIGVYVSDHIADLVSAGTDAEEAIDLPLAIDGDDYVVYPSADSQAIYVLPAHAYSKAYSVPIICGKGVSVNGFISSRPDAHRITFDPVSNIVTLA